MPAAPIDFSSSAETIEAPRLGGVGNTLDATPSGDESSASLKKSARRRVALVEGSTPHESSETREVLRGRLRIAAVLLFIGIGSFLVWAVVKSIFDPKWGEYGSVFYAHAAVTLLLGLLSWKLCVRCSFSLRSLRIAELLVFGGPAVFFLMVSWRQLAAAAAGAEFPYVPTIISGWMLLIFSYAVFIPNTWQRAARVIGAMAVAPVAVNVTAYWQNEAFRRLVDSDTFRGIIVEQGMKMAIAAMTGIVGVYTINALRREAFVARQLGQYRLKKLLGSGGMGEVYLAEHQMMKRPCAVKIIRPEKAGDPKVLARFEREVRATAKLSHWNSIDIYDYGRTEDGTFYYVMEFLPGHNLGEVVEMDGPMAPVRIVYLMRQICDALSEAHEQGLVHRDIKPANIFVAYRGGMFDVAKLLDFGLAKPLATTGADAGLTQEGSITGSPLFMSPEQATGSEEVDGRSDVYSLGAVLYFMATGKPPFQYDRPLQVMIAHASEDPEPPRIHNGNIPSELEEVILRSLEKRPADRFQTVRELRDALDAVPVDGAWSSDLAGDWWSNHGCPVRKAMAAEAVELAAV